MRQEVSWAREGLRSTLHMFQGSLRLIVSYLGQLMGPSLTAAEKGEVAPKGHVATKRQGEDSKDTLLTPLHDVPDACGKSTRHCSQRKTMPKDSKPRPSIASY